MRRLAVLFLASMITAFSVYGCDGGSLLQPEPEESLQLITTAKKGWDVSTPKMVPYKGSGVWWGVPEPAVEREGFDCAALGGLFLDQGAGEIEVTHLGKSDYSYVNCWGPEDIIYQTGTVRAANGDELYWFGLKSEGMGTEVDWVEGNYQMGPMSFGGGTGRFENAIGWFTTWGTFSEEEGVWTGTEIWEGMISSVGSKG